MIISDALSFNFLLLLPGNLLTGNLPSELGMLTELSRLFVDHNTGLVGVILNEILDLGMFQFECSKCEDDGWR